MRSLSVPRTVTTYSGRSRDTTAATSGVTPGSHTTCAATATAVADVQARPLQASALPPQRRIRPPTHLQDARVVAHVEELHASHVPVAVHPAAQRDGLLLLALAAHVLGAQRAGAVRPRGPRQLRGHQLVVLLAPLLLLLLRCWGALLLLGHLRRCGSRRHHKPRGPRAADIVPATMARSNCRVTSCCW